MSTPPTSPIVQLGSEADRLRPLGFVFRQG